MKAVAKKVVSDQAEDKYTTLRLLPSGVPVEKAGNIAQTDVYRLMPEILNGSNTWQRIGDKIRVKSMRVDVMISASAKLTDAFLATIRFLVLTDKSNKDSNLMATITAPYVEAELLETGTAQQGFTGRHMDLLERINKRRFTVIADKRLTLAKGFGRRVAPTVVAGDQASTFGPVTYKFSVKIPTPKTLIYQAPAASWPTNFAPFAVLGYAFNESNAASDPAEQVNLRVVYNTLVHLDYEDV